MNLERAIVSEWKEKTKMGGWSEQEKQRHTIFQSQQRYAGAHV